jgi:Tol biopolymer transport system component
LPVIDISADGGEFIYNTTDGMNLRSLASFEPVLIPGVDAQHAIPEFSPDAKSLAFIRPGAASGGITQVELARIPVTGGSPRPLGIIGNRNQVPLGLSWEPDDTIVYAVGGSIWRVSANGGAPEQIVEMEPGEAPEMAELLPGGDWVLFSVVNGEGPADWDTAEIVAQSISTGERRMLYSGGSSARYVPTGHLVFAFGAALYAMPFDADAVEITGGPVPVVNGVRRDTNTGIAQYAFSGNGTLIYVPGVLLDAGNATLVVADGQGHVDNLPMPGGIYADARVSPDGRFAAYTVTYPDGEDIEIYDLSGNAAPRRLTFGGTSRYPVWSRDGTRVFFQSTRDGPASLYSQLSDGSGGDPVRLTTAGEGETHAPDSAAPDGERLTFTAVDSSGVLSVWMLNLETGEAEPLIAQPNASISQSIFSPDGKWIAYQSTETGRSGVFVQPFPLTGARFQLPGSGENHHPAWSADGSELFYFPGIGQFESIRVTTKPRFTFGAPEALMDVPMNAAPAGRRQYAVLPDGSGFLGAAAGGAAAGPESNSIRIVQNWFDELERLVPLE